jgi:hypothetical protein
VILRDDIELTGFVLRRTPAGLVLKDDLLVEHDLETARIRETHESPLSAMPEGLLAPLTAQEAADLLDYLGTTESSSGP